MKILNLFGSSHDRFYYDLSQMYASAVLRPEGTEHVFAAVAPDGQWRFGASPDDLGPAMSVADALARLPKVDLVVPHMFCRAGMTSYRALLEDIAGVPVVGAPATVAGLATSKIWTRDIVSAAGVRVPAGQPLRRGDTCTLEAPFVVKPDKEDNSLGVSVVRDAADTSRALDHAMEFDDIALAEVYVPGREIRAAVIERDGELLVPSFIEYPVSDARPIREVADKLEATQTPGAMRQSERSDAQPICPAEVDTNLAEKLAAAARTAHRAIGARHYSLFDFRVHAETGTPYMLEAGLFWSFSSLSAISKMLAGSGMDPAETARSVWSDAIEGHEAANSRAA